MMPTLSSLVAKWPMRSHKILRHFECSQFIFFNSTDSSNLQAYQSSSQVPIWIQESGPYLSIKSLGRTVPLLKPPQSPHCYIGEVDHSLYDGWYICAAVLTPFFDPLGTKLDLFGVFFLIHQHKNDLLGTNPHIIRSFWSQNTIFPSIFLGPIFSGPRHTPSKFRTEYPPPRGRTVPLLKPPQSPHCYIGEVDHSKQFPPTPGHTASPVLSR